jgi:Ca-activated chloride channel family protein
MPPELHLLRPAWLLALIPLALGLWRLARRGSAGTAWQGLVDAHLLPHLLVGEEGRLRRLPLLLLGVTGVTGVLALAGPAWERLPQPAYQSVASRVIVLDISDTMNAADLPPSRLAHARYEIQDLLRRFREGRTALIAYGAEPYVVSPLTGDAKTIAAQVPDLSTGLLPVRGPRDAGLALREAGRLLDQAGASHGQVILLTDGLDRPAAALGAARALREQGYRLSILGLGTPAGAPVPVAGGGFSTDSSGATQIASLDEGALRTLAASAGGQYVTATLDDRDIETLVHDAPVDRRAAASDLRADQWREEGPWLLLALLPLAALAFRRGWVSPLLLALLLAQPPRAEAFSWPDLWLRPDQQAARLFEQGRAPEAAQTFRRPDWQAAATYEAGDYAQTLQLLDGLDSAAAWYNRGNTLARLGSYAAAIDAYEQALAGNPDDADARHNRELVSRLLEQQQQQQQQQQPGSQSGSGAEGHAGGGEGQAQGQDNTRPSGGQDAAQSTAGDSNATDGTQAQAAANGSDEQQAKAGPGATPGSTGNETQPPAQPAPAGATPPPGAEAAGPGQPPGTENRAAQGDTPGARAPATAPGPADGTAPGLADLLGSPDAGTGRSGAHDTAASAPPLSESQQAMEHQLNRVPDDPGGLLRQRFLLQHLRRHGQL